MSWSGRREKVMEKAAAGEDEEEKEDHRKMEIAGFMD